MLCAIASHGGTDGLHLVVDAARGNEDAIVKDSAAARALAKLDATMTRTGMQWQDASGGLSGVAFRFKYETRDGAPGIGLAAMLTSATDGRRWTVLTLLDAPARRQDTIWSNCLTMLEAECRLISGETLMSEVAAADSSQE
jgi:hypothetical protein